MKTILQSSVVIAYLALGLFQLAAVMAGLQDWVGFHWIIAAPISLFIAYLPIVGTVVGMFGAVVAWNWSWLQAAGLFLGPLAAIVLLVIGYSALQQNESRVYS